MFLSSLLSMASSFINNLYTIVVAILISRALLKSFLLNVYAYINENFDSTN